MDSHWKMYHETNKLPKEPFTKEQIQKYWKPMPSRKGSRYIIQLTLRGINWINSHLVVSNKNGKTTVRTKEEHESSQRRQNYKKSKVVSPASSSKSNSSPNDSPYSIIDDISPTESTETIPVVETKKRTRKTFFDEIFGDDAPEPKKSCPNSTWSDEVIKNILRSLESTISASETQDTPFDSQRLIELFQESAPNTFNKLCDQLFLNGLQYSPTLPNDIPDDGEECEMVYLSEDS